MHMRLDHLTFATGPGGLASTARELGDWLGTEAKDGGFHPRFGTRNNVIPLTGGRYLEIAEVLDHPAAAKAVYGQAVRRRSEQGGGWMSWVLSVDDLAPWERRLKRKAVPGSRRFPDGRLLTWHQIGARGMLTDPQLPYFLHWESADELLPSALDSDVSLLAIEMIGSRSRVEEWLGEPLPDVFDGVTIEFSSPFGHPGIAAAVFSSPGRGTLRI